MAHTTLRLAALRAFPLLGLLPAGLSAADVEHGKALYQQTCALCHATGLETRPTGGQGPLLAGIFGRPSAVISSFGYTKALMAAHLTWDAATLDKFLTAPGTLVPGTSMVIAVVNPTDRQDLIAFLGTLRPVGSSAASVPSEAKEHPRTAGDWQLDGPGVHHQIDLAALPAPFATLSAGNTPKTVDRPAGAQLAVPPGFQIQPFASDLSGPRLLRTAPNGDLFIAETRRGRIRVIRAPDGASRPSENQVFATGLTGPFGIAFYPLGPDPEWVYVGNLNSVVRFPYRNGDLKARGKPETVVAQLAETTGGHSTRDVAFSLDGRRLFISVGSGSNVADGLPDKSPAEIQEWEASHAKGSAWGYEALRADVLVTDPQGRAEPRIFASGIRNAVGVAIQPGTGKLWVSTNERDGLGDDLVPDYITHVEEGGFYGWPWYYMGDHEDPRNPGARPDLLHHVLVPDVPVQSHSASLQMMFYPSEVSGPGVFPAKYRGGIFAAFHGSWNRTGRTGSKVIFVPVVNGVATGGYEDFLTGFVVDDGHVWGRPVGVTAGHDGSLFVTEDVNGMLWKITYRAP